MDRQFVAGLRAAGPAGPHGDIAMPNLRILLVDDSPAFLAAARRMVAAEHGLEVVGCARNGAEALEQAARLRPDLVLMDIAMPEMDGLEATRRMKAQGDEPRVAIVTLHDTPQHRAAAEAAGADGFVAKSSLRENLPAISRTLRGAITPGGTRDTGPGRGSLCC